MPTLDYTTPQSVTCDVISSLMHSIPCFNLWSQDLLLGQLVLKFN